MNLNHEKSLKEVIEELMQSKSLRHPYQQIHLQAEWEKLMGKTIAKYTEKVIIKNHTLIIYTTNASLKNELHVLKSEILQKINNSIKGVNLKEVVVK